MRTAARPLALLLALALVGCDGFNDFVDDPLGEFQLTVRVADIAVDVGEDGLPVGVIPGQVSTTEAQVPLGIDVARVQEVESIVLSPSDFTFDPVIAGSGTVRVSIRVSGGGGVVDVSGPVEVVDGAVTDVFEVPPSALSEAGAVLNSAEVMVRIETEVTRIEDPAAPPAGVLTLTGYSVTVIATP